MSRYGRFAVMILAAVGLMYGITYLNTYEIEHVYFSEMRFYMAVVMGSAMAVIMLLFMLHMYKDRRVNAGILVVSAVLFAAALWVVRSQATIDDVAYMKAMIPHHSIAILASRRADIDDPRVRRLADQIIESQLREIDEMKELLRELEGKQ